MVVLTSIQIFLEYCMKIKYADVDSCLCFALITLVASYSGLTDRYNIFIHPATILLKISDSSSVPICPYLHLNGAPELFVGTLTLRFKPLELTGSCVLVVR